MSNARRHEATHTASSAFCVSAYTCHHRGCDRSFSTSSDLHQHEATHPAISASAFTQDAIGDITENQDEAVDQEKDEDQISLD